MIVIVAPYSPPGRENQKIAHFGAARKIEAVVSALKIVDECIILINSSPIGGIDQVMIKEDSEVGSSTVIEIFLPDIFGGWVAKLLAVAKINSVLDLIEKYGKPRMVWCYNEYMYEMIFAKLAKNRYNCKIVLELEDGIFARNRGFNIKPWLDYFSAKYAESSIDWAVCVNKLLAKKMQNKNINSVCLPGMIQGKNIHFKYRAPFSSEKISIGYFGGLSEEKGANLIIEFLDLYKNYDVSFIVTGSGALEKTFLERMDADGRLNYLGSVNNDELIMAINGVDIIINPHKILNDSSQIFPSKVIEAVASGRLVVSTALPDPGINNILNGICYFDGTLSNLRHSIDKSRDFYFSNREYIAEAANLINAKLSPAGFAEKIKEIMQDS